MCFAPSPSGVQVQTCLESSIQKGLSFNRTLFMTAFLGTVGSTTNLMSNDAERVFEASMFLHYLWASPTYVVVIVVLVTARIGFAALIGFGLLILMIPFQAVLGKMVGETKRKMMPAGDARTELMSQLLRGIQVIKAYCWDDVFLSRLQAERKTEVKQLYTFQLPRAVMRAFLYTFQLLRAVMRAFLYE